MQDIVKHKFYYGHSNFSAAQALRDKRWAINGKLVSEERARKYLQAAGWKCCSREMWSRP
jgi:hypothetical protein